MESVLATSSPRLQAGDATLGGAGPPWAQQRAEHSSIVPSRVGDADHYSASSQQSAEPSIILPPYAGDATPSSLETQQSAEFSRIIPTLPYHVSHVAPSIDISTEQGDATISSIHEPDSIDNLLIKASCRKDKIERNFILPEVEIGDISTLKDLKFYLARKLPIRAVGGVGYIVKGRQKVWFHTDGELQKLIDGTLVKGKGALWCDCIMQSVGSDDDVNPAEENDKDTSPAQKRRKVTAMDERRERVQNLFEELKEKHGSAYSGPQYRLWAEAVASGSHTNTEEPPLGSMFRRQNTCKARHQSHCSCSATAIASVNLTSSPPHEHQARGSSLTPKSAASLRSSYIKQIKELHELLDIDAISEEDFKRQKEKILAMMDSL